MTWQFTLALLLGLTAVVAVICYRVAASEGGRAFAGVTAAFAGALTVLMLGLSCFTIVSTRNVGIVLSFGKPVGTLTNGLHFKKPWLKVPELNGTIRTDNQLGGFDGDTCTGGTVVRLANNSTACVDNTIRWRIVPTEGDVLYRDYQNDDNIRDSLVTRELDCPPRVDRARAGDRL